MYKMNLYQTVFPEFSFNCEIDSKKIHCFRNIEILFEAMRCKIQLKDTRKTQTRYLSFKKDLLSKRMHNISNNYKMNKCT